MVSLIVFIPLLTAFFLLTLNKNAVELVRRTAFGASLLTFVISLGLFTGFDSETAEFQFVERYAWISEFGIEYYVGVDGISLFLVLLTTFLSPLVILSTWSSVEHLVRSISFSFSSWKPA